MQDKIGKCKILFLYHVESLNVMMKSLRSAGSPFWHSAHYSQIRFLLKDPMRGPAMEWHLLWVTVVVCLACQSKKVIRLFSLPMTPFVKSNVYHHLITLSMHQLIME